MTRITFRLTPEDEAAVAAIREHLRGTKSPWVNRSDTIRAALREAARIIAAAGEAVGIQ
jgi:Arc/MetJ-type ribon-helix-helix transcriptional regulator